MLRAKSKVFCHILSEYDPSKAITTNWTGLPLDGCARIEGDAEVAIGAGACPGADCTADVNSVGCASCLEACPQAAASNSKEKKAAPIVMDRKWQTSNKANLLFCFFFSAPCTGMAVKNYLCCFARTPDRLPLIRLSALLTVSIFPFPSY